MPKVEEYLKRQAALGYEPSLAGVDDEDFDYIPSWSKRNRNLGAESEFANATNMRADYNGSRDVGAGPIQDDYLKAKAERFEKEYEQHRQYMIARGKQPSTKEQMYNVFKEFGTLDRKNFNTGFALRLAEKYRGMAKNYDQRGLRGISDRLNKVADSMEQREKRNPNWKEEQDEFDFIVGIYDATKGLMDLIGGK